MMRILCFTIFTVSVFELVPMGFSLISVPTVTSPKDTLLGYIISSWSVAIPKYVLQGLDMTATKCADICGLNKYNYSVVLAQSCTCTQDLLSSGVYDCNALTPCPGDAQESCGCSTNLYPLVYVTGAGLVYKITITTGSKTYDSNGFAGSLSLSMFGPDNRDNGEVAVTAKLSAGSMASLEITARDLYGLEMLRMGNRDDNDAWYLSKVVIVDPSTANQITFSCNTYLDPNATTTSVANFYVDSTKNKYTVQGDPYFTLEKEQPKMKMILCANDSATDCKAEDQYKSSSYVKFAGYYYKRIIPLFGLIFDNITDCVNVVSPSSKVSLTKSSNTGPGSYYTAVCPTGLFFTSNISTIKITCQKNGTWSQPFPIPDCVSGKV